MSSAHQSQIRLCTEDTAFSASQFSDIALRCLGNESVTGPDKQASQSLLLFSATRKGNSLGFLPAPGIPKHMRTARHLCTPLPTAQVPPPFPRPTAVEPPAKGRQSFRAHKCSPEWSEEGSGQGLMRTLLAILAAGSLVGEYSPWADPILPRSQGQHGHPHLSPQQRRFQFLLC